MTETIRRSSRPHWWNWCLAAWASGSLFLSGCTTFPWQSTNAEPSATLGQGNTAVRAKSLAPHGSPEDLESENRTLLERISFWDRMGLDALDVTPSGESFTLKGDGLKEDVAAPRGSYKWYLLAGHELYRQGRVAEAGRLFKFLADRERVPPQIAEEARYHEAECYRVQGYYPSAADTYADLLNKFPSTLYREQAVRHLYDIANYWLDDTRARLEEVKEYNEGKRWWVDSRFISFDRTKPFLDREGNALKHLETVRFNDINGPLADKALYLCGSVQFANGNYRDADYYFTQIHERHPNSEYAPKALEYAIIAKHLSTGGSDYDGRKSAEARKLIDSAMANYPELAAQRDEMEKKRAYITLQQAEKDFKQADFYQRKGKLGAAYFYFELIKTTYKETPYARLAAERSAEIRAEVERHNGTLPPVPGQAPAPAPGPGPAPGSGPAPVPGPAPTPGPELAPAPQRGM
jgi:outer membrane protein assembly factor BamD (BamD/ComL family)